MVVVFFDGVRGPENSNQLLALRDSYSEFQSEGTEVIAISVATPFRNRQGIERAGSFPFPLLSDVDYAVHKMWGLGNAETAGPVEAVFLVDRRGIIRWSETSSDALISPKILLQKLAQIP